MRSRHSLRLDRMAEAYRPQMADGDHAFPLLRYQAAEVAGHRVPDGAIHRRPAACDFGNFQDLAQF